MANEYFREAANAMKDIFASDISTSDMVALTMMIVQYKKYGLKDLLEELDKDISVSDDIKKKFSNLFKKIDYYVSRSGGVRLKNFVKDFNKNEVYESEISDNEIQEIVMGFDLRGWEQDGDGPIFINVGGDGERKEFHNWSEAGRFLDELSEKD